MNNNKQEKQNKNLTKPTVNEGGENLHFSASMDCELHSSLIVAIHENL